MPVQNIPPSKNTRSQIIQAILAPTARAPLENTPSVHQLSANLDRGPPMEGEAPSRRGGMKSRRSRSFYVLLCGYPGIFQGPIGRLGEAEDEEGKESMEEEASEETQVAAALTGVPEAPESPNLAHFNKIIFSQAEPNFLKMMEQITQLIRQITQEVAPRENYRAPEFKTSSIKAPDSFNDTKSHKLKGFIQSCQSIFHNDPEDIFSERKKGLYSTSFLTSRAENGLNNISQISLMRTLPTS
ncbi:hypothetical protein O181_069361 [Austropuccinia psidii MF-1]|uniref:Uncharacterized protein n=1 Tax=Austropuccinia psidii MF-1 TaxID=1389203 RepID=A0A9Q3I4R6_9BASI|nr:hypothetical protein [Austropuccinia psidii MF-1]